MPIIAGRASAAYGAGFGAITTAPFELVGSYDALASVSLSTTTASVTFAGIPTGYKHLQIRGIQRSDFSGTFVGTTFRFNGDTTSSYAFHNINGNGTAAAAGANPSVSAIDGPTLPAASITSGIFGGVVADILDYNNTSKNKVIRILGGVDANGSGNISLRSGLWVNTSAITSIEIYPGGGSWTQYSQFALYGVR